MLSTGDLDGNVKRLKLKLRQISYTGHLDDASVRLGLPTSILPILNFILTKASRIVAKLISENGFELTGKTDARFVQTAFKLFRDYFNLRPGLTIAQFLQEGFAERKVCLLLSVIERCRACHAEGNRKGTVAFGGHNMVKHSRPKITPMDGGNEIDGVPSAFISEATESAVEQGTSGLHRREGKGTKHK
ncbi:g1261 [Coccomyxa elongata]